MPSKDKHKQTQQEPKLVSLTNTSDALSYMQTCPTLPSRAVVKQSVADDVKEVTALPISLTEINLQALNQQKQVCHRVRKGHMKEQPPLTVRRPIPSSL